MDRLEIALVLAVCVYRASCAQRIKRDVPAGNVPITDSQRLDIVRIHNDLRRSSQSSNMRYMTWDSELEWIAENYGKKCVYKHSSDRKHSRYTSVGENIYATNGKLSSFNPSRAVNLWYKEIIDFDFDTRTCKPGKLCGHYTQIVWATSFKVGCALTVCDRLSEINLKNSLLFVCNYATSGNIVYGENSKMMPVFLKGKACSECDGADYCRDQLCANSARDFIDDTCNYGDDKESTVIGLAVAVGVMTVLVVLLLLYIFLRKRIRLKRSASSQRQPSFNKKKESVPRQVRYQSEPEEGDLLSRIAIRDVHLVSQEDNTSRQNIASPTSGCKRIIPPPPKLAPPAPPSQRPELSATHCYAY